MEPSKTSGSIGVQQILPRTATGWQGQSPVPIQPTSQSSGDGGGDTPSEPERGATPDGVGKIVDKIA
jgi:hypothetical protein